MEAWQLAVLIVVIIIAFWMLSRQAVRQTKESIAAQFRTVTEHLNTQDTELETLKGNVQKVELDLARNYVRRNDHVRDVASLKAQFSALATAVERKLDEHSRVTIMTIKREMRK
jgi:predicted Holliday junction resolvase-like endonuclease